MLVLVSEAPYRVVVPGGVDSRPGGQSRRPVHFATPTDHHRVMDDLQRRRCATCEHEITGLARLARHGRKIAALERFTATPPPLPAGATLVFWAATPCLHPLAHVDAWDWAVDAGWGELPGAKPGATATSTIRA